MKKVANFNSQAQHCISKVVNKAITLTLVSLAINGLFNSNFGKHVQAANCKNEYNNDVDWFIIYKIPKIEGHEDNVLREGLGYAYLDSEDVNWKYPKKSIENSDNALAYTMKQLYDNNDPKDFMFLTYNDQTPDKKSHSSTGHTKGVLMSNHSAGAWLVHSLPRFPLPVLKKYRLFGNKRNQYVYPPNGASNGQDFLCMSFDYSQMLNISQLIYYNSPYIYDKNLPKEFTSENQYLQWLSQKKNINKKPPWAFTKIFYSLWNKTPFVAFAKYKKFDADIYSDMIAPYYGSNLLSETWQLNSKQALNSSCLKQPTVQNIKEISFDIISNNTNQVLDCQRKISFSELNDHSKWAITSFDTNNAVKTNDKNSGDSRPVVCIGDLNRGYPQKKRSGGMVCTENLELWKSFMKIISDIEACPLKPKH
ncbi:unnamed protein product [Gordionus sp. m RMFG-2023]|uniref:plancitoxin-1-like n=1 Tax=Gordionus sp. m RMFG-2023 TaxID=3053472 RepID=UPI0030E3F760